MSAPLKKIEPYRLVPCDSTDIEWDIAISVVDLLDQPEFRWMKKDARDAVLASIAATMLDVAQKANPRLELSLRKVHYAYKELYPSKIAFQPSSQQAIH